MAWTTDYLVTVCDACLRASCWHGEFYCDGSRGAGTKDIPASELVKMGSEHPSNFSREKLLRVCGSIRSATL